MNHTLIHQQKRSQNDLLLLFASFEYCNVNRLFQVSSSESALIVMNAQISGTRRQRKLRSLHVPNTGTGLVPLLLLAAVLVWEDDMLYKCDRQRLVIPIVFSRVLTLLLNKRNPKLTC